MARDLTVVQTDETLPLSRAIPLSLQHLMAMFGATVLVPILTGLDPGVGLMTSGIGTIIYLICVRNKIPSYLGSSFAFIAPLIAVGGGPGGKNIPAALGGLVAAGIVYMIVAGIVKAFGTGWLSKLLPPALVGSIVIVIGLGLSAVAVKMCLFPMADPEPGCRPQARCGGGHHPDRRDRLLELLQGLHEDDPGSHGHRRRLHRVDPAGAREL